uniref:Uncharacterized protein n=1 Tax=Vespula pensylvanica TaxID=30213 RepID=A0A834KLQ8_VESPE|nr:hypothetical protein H0235_013885 [Vespula pensylvanica]
MRRAKRCFERTKRPSSEDAPSGVTPKVGGKRVNCPANSNRVTADNELHLTPSLHNSTLRILQCFKFSKRSFETRY